MIHIYINKSLEEDSNQNQIKTNEAKEAVLINEANEYSAKDSEVFQ